MARRVVVDTNVLISGYLWKGTARRVLDLVRAEPWTLLSSSATLQEFIRVLAYEKFALTPAEIAPFIDDLRQVSEFVHVKSKLHPIVADPTDNIFLNLAVDGNANVIVYGDRHLLELKAFQSIAILSVRAFLLFAASAEKQGSA
jgi:putative PIN family toxin of toxin-antitoxin system